MGKKTSATSVEYASEAEVEAAISNLSAADTERLKRFAAFKAKGLLALGVGIDRDDILQEAMRRTIAGSRRWPKHIPFVKHLIEVVRSVASHARRKVGGIEIVHSDPPAASEVTEEEWDAEWLPSSTLPDQERIAIAREELARTEKRFEGDERVLLVIEGLSTEMRGPEIQKALGITQTEYETAMTRLRRGARRKE